MSLSHFINFGLLFLKLSIRHECNKQFHCDFNHVPIDIKNKRGHLITIYNVYMNTESLKKAQHNKIENVAGSVWLSLFMNGNGKCKFPSTPPSTGLSRIQHLTQKWWNFEFRNIRRCVHTAIIMEPSMWHSSAIPWKAAYGPQVK
jgi:hypothetical protein